ncbi:MAG: CRISPR-associated ring nuclease, partial [Anaerolineae bacterium]
MALLNESTLICTLGGQPQIVTFALDILLRRGEAVREVVALHLALSDERVGRAVKRLRAEFKDNQYRGWPCRVGHRTVWQGEYALDKIQTDAAAEATRQIVHELITELKKTGRTLHLCISGGPRIMGLMALSTALLHCRHQDKVWHVYTRPEFQREADEGAMMHDETGENTRLIQVPMVPWGAYIPALHALQQTPAALMSAQIAWLDETERRRCQAVWRALTPRRKEVLHLLANGHTPQQVAQALTIT